MNVVRILGSVVESRNSKHFYSIGTRLGTCCHGCKQRENEGDIRKRRRYKKQETRKGNGDEKRYVQQSSSVEL
jgi:hypothetical protein